MPWYNWIINHFYSFWWDYVAPLLLLDTQPPDGISCHTLQLKKRQITSFRFPTFSPGSGLWAGMPGILNHVKRFRLTRSMAGSHQLPQQSVCGPTGLYVIDPVYRQNLDRSQPLDYHSNVLLHTLETKPSGSVWINRNNLDSKCEDWAKSFMIRWLNCLFPHRKWKQHRKLKTDLKQLNKTYCIMPFQSYCWLQSPAKIK